MMPDSDATPRTSTGPHPGGVRETESPTPGGAVVGEAGIAEEVDPDGADPAGGADLGDDITEERVEEPGDDAAIGSPEEEARRDRPIMPPD